MLAKLASAAFAFFVAGLNDGSLGALIPYMLCGYHTSTGSVAVFYGIQFAGWVVAALSRGYARAYISSGGTLMVGAGCQLLAYALRPWTPPFALFCAMFFLTAIGQAFQDSEANTFVSSVQTAHRWLGVVHASYGLGGLVGPLVATAMASAKSQEWTYLYWVLSGLAACNLAFVGWAFWGDVMWVKLP